MYTFTYKYFKIVSCQKKQINQNQHWQLLGSLPMFIKTRTRLQGHGVFHSIFPIENETNKDPADDEQETWNCANDVKDHEVHNKNSCKWPINLISTVNIRDLAVIYDTSLQNTLRVKVNIVGKVSKNLTLCIVLLMIWYQRPHNKSGWNKRELIESQTEINRDQIILIVCFRKFWPGVVSGSLENIYPWCLVYWENNSNRVT